MKFQQPDSDTEEENDREAKLALKRYQQLMYFRMFGVIVDIDTDEEEEEEKKEKPEKKEKTPEEIAQKKVENRQKQLRYLAAGLKLAEYMIEVSYKIFFIW
jgi:hypothetical protein